MALVGGGLGNAVLFSIGAALRAAGSRVIYFAGYKRMRDRYKVEEIERAADVDRLVLRRGAGLRARRAQQDRSFVGNIVAGMAAYAEGRLGPQPVPLGEAEHMIVDRLGPHDAGGGGGAARRCWRRT